MPGALSLVDEDRAPGRVQVVKATPSDPICSAAALAANEQTVKLILPKIFYSSKYNLTCVNFLQRCATGSLTVVRIFTVVCKQSIVLHEQMME
jgi:hypothetical protein